MTAGQRSPGLRPRDLTQPAVARLPLHQPPGLPLQGGAQRLPQVRHLDPLIGGQLPQGQPCPQRVLLVAKVSQHRDAEHPGIGDIRPADRFDRLKDDADLSAKARRQFVRPLRLQQDESVGQFERPLSALAAANVAVEVSAGQGDDQRPVRPELPPARDGGITLARVQGDQQIALGEAGIVLLGDKAMPQADEDVSPAVGSDPVALARCRRRWAGHEDAHVGIVATGHQSLVASRGCERIKKRPEEDAIVRTPSGRRRSRLAWCQPNNSRPEILTRSS